MGAGVLAGLILNLTAHGRATLPGTIRYRQFDRHVGLALGRGWLQRFYRPARHGRKVAYLTMASFGFLAIALGTLLPFTRAQRACHGIRKIGGRRGGRVAGRASGGPGREATP